MEAKKMFTKYEEMLKLIGEYVYCKTVYAQ